MSSMNRRHISIVTVLLGMALLLSLILIAINPVKIVNPRAYALAPAASPLISQGVPVYTNGSNYSGGSQSAINDNNYGSQLCSPTQPVSPGSPFYAAYDLSGVS